MKKVEIHCIKPDGKVYVTNHLWSENAAIAASGAGYGKELEVLRTKAIRMAGSWASVFPDNRYIVVVK